MRRIPEIFFALIALAGLLSFEQAAQAKPGFSLTWSASPSSGDWNTAGNWVGDFVPNDPTLTASFSQSSGTAVSVSGSTTINTILFNSGASAYTVTVSATETLSVSGTGVVNNSGTVQNIVNASGELPFLSETPAVPGQTTFSGSATVEGNVTFTNTGGTTGFAKGGITYFENTSNAGSGIFNNIGGTMVNGMLAFGGGTVFHDTSSAGNATINSNGGSPNAGGYTYFYDNSTAANAHIISAFSGTTIFYNNSTAGGATISSTEFGFTYFYNNSNAGNASLSLNNESFALFSDNSSGSNATLTSSLRGYTEFSGTSTAGNATLIALGGTGGAPGGGIYFAEQADGGMASVTANGNAVFDLSTLSGTTMNIGSIAGSGSFCLGGVTLTVGGNNQSTVVSGIIQDGGTVQGREANSGTSGGIIKTGTGTLTLNGTNTYTGVTNVLQGSLVVNGSIASSSGVTVSAGASLGGYGNVGAISGGGLIAPGDPKIMTATQVDPSGGMSFAFQFSGTGQPIYSNASASGNDVLHLTGAMPFKFTLTSSNIITVDFSAIEGSLAIGQTYYGGFFLDNAAALGTPTFDYTGTGSFAVQFDGFVTVPSADFDTGTVTNGEVMEFEVVPEPGTWSLLGVGAITLFACLRFRTKMFPQDLSG